MVLAAGPHVGGTIEGVTPTTAALIGAVGLCVGTLIQFVWSMVLLRSGPPKVGEEGRRTYELWTAVGWAFMFGGAIATVIAAVNLATGAPAQ